MPTYHLEGQSWSTQPIRWDFASLTLPQDQAGNPFSSAITQQDVQAVIATAFEAWSRAAGLQFVYAPQDSASDDIRIGWGALPPATDSGREIGETSYYYYTATNKFVPDVLVRLLDPSQLALSSSSGSLAYGGRDPITLYQIALHEIGHAIGLSHNPDDPSSIMYAYVSSLNRQLAPVDIQGAEAIYGVPQATFVDIGANQETISGSLSGAASTVFGSSGALDYAGGNGLIVLGSGSARVHDGSVTVFAGAGSLTASNNQSGEFILGGGHSSIGGGAVGSHDVVFGGSGVFTYAGVQEAASVIGGTGGATIVGGTGSGYYLGGSDGNNSLTATGIGTVLVGGGNNDTLVGASAGYSYLVAGKGNETLIGSLGAGGGSGTDRFYLGSGSDAVGLGTGPSVLVTGAGTATIYGGGGTSNIFGGTGGTDLYVERPGSSMDITGFRRGIDHISGVPTAVSVSGGSTVLSFAGGATITVNGLTDPSGIGLVS